MKTKVIVISTVGLIYDGITSVIRSYLKAMDLSGLEIHVVATGKAEPDICDELEKLGCIIVPLPPRREETKKYFFALKKYIKKNKIKVMHAHGNSGTLAIEMLAGKLGGCKKRIAHSHNTRCDQVKADKLLRPIFNMFYTDALACGVDAGKWLYKNRQFRVLRNGRDLDAYSFDKDVREAMRAEYKLGDRLAIGHVGGFFEQKNHAFLIEIFREVLRLEPSAELFLVGDGPLRAEIEEKCRDISDSVVFVKTTNRVSDYLQMMDGMLLPSLFEGLPLVAVEWQINGLPCLFADTITRDCAFAENIEFLSLDDSPAVWAEKLIRIINENEREALAAAAPQNARDAGFDIKESADELKELYSV